VGYIDVSGLAGKKFMKKIVYVVNTINFFNSHREALAVEASRKGLDVYVLSNMNDSKGMINPEFTYYHVGFTRSGQNIISEFLTFFRVLFLFLKIRPDLLHLVTIKPILYGGVAARIAGNFAVVVAISGLGSVFSASSGLPLLRLKIVKYLYGFALKQKRIVVIFQNEDDRQKLLAISSVDIKRTRIIRGSGVSLSDYPYLSEPNGVTTVSMAARLLKEKGICEFVGAARILKNRGIPVNMQVIGSPDYGNPYSVTVEEISKWKNENLVSFLGYRRDIAALYAESNIVCLPSYYGEGLPKSLVEAAACGRAVITTDMPGCRDAVIPGVSGVLIPPRDEVALADSIQTLISDPARRKKMSQAGRKLAEEVFKIELVVEKHMNIYRELLSNASG